jgi:hypothetical protein
VVAARLKLGAENDCWAAACWLFSEIEKRHDNALAKRMFAALGAPKAQFRRRLGDSELVTAYELGNQHFGWNVQRTARHLAEANKKLPPHARWGLSGSQSEDALRKAIRLATKRERRNKG